VIAGDAVVRHHGSRTFIGTGVDARALLRENRRRFLEKWAGNGSGGDPHLAFGHPLPAYRARVEEARTGELRVVSCELSVVSCWDRLIPPRTSIAKP
jgi:hypothetical protein